MRAAQPTCKLFTSAVTADTGRVIDIFHAWIRERRFGDELLLIDVASYTHVHHGPGVLLVAHEAYLGLDEVGGRPGLLYRRRRGEAVDALDGFRQAARHALRACRMLAEDSGGALAFATGELELGFDDRLRATGGESTFAALQPALRSFGELCFPGGFELAPAGNARSCFRARITATVAPRLDELERRLGGVG